MFPGAEEGHPQRSFFMKMRVFHGEGNLMEFQWPPLNKRIEK